MTLSLQNQKHRLEILDWEDCFKGLPVPISAAVTELETIYDARPQLPEETLKTRVQIVVQEKLLPLLLDRNQESYENGAFLTLAGECASRSSLVAQIYCGSIEDRNAPFAHALNPHEGFAKVVQFCKEQGALFPSQDKWHALSRLLNLRPDSEPPLSSIALKSKIECSLESLSRILVLHPHDEMASSLVTYIEQFRKRLALLRDDTQSLLTDRDEWTVLDEQMTLLESLPLSKQKEVFTKVSEFKEQFYPLLKPMKIYQKCVREQPPLVPFFGQTKVAYAVENLQRWENKQLQDLTPKRPFKQDVSSSVEKLRQEADKAFVSHEDELSFLFADWARECARNLEDSSDLYKTVVEQISLLEEICIDPDTRFPLEETAVLSNMEGKRTYNLESALLRKEVYPNFTTTPHPILPKFLRWMNVFQTRVRDWEIAETARKVKAEQLRHAGIQKAFQEALQNALAPLPGGMESLRKTAQTFGQNKDKDLASRVERVAEVLRREDIAILTVQQQLNALGKKVAELQKSLQRKEGAQKETEANVERAKKFAIEILQEAKRLQQELEGGEKKTEILAAQHENIELALRLNEERAIGLKKEYEQIKKDLASRDKGFLGGVIVLCGFIAGAAVTLGTGNPAAGATVAASVSSAGGIATIK
jgi:hypothetical protein